MRPGNYPEQAATYDQTRSASRWIVEAVAAHLGAGAGRSLADVAGGTGNYARAFADRGFRVTIVDAEPAMLARSVEKLGPGHGVVGDAAALPLRDGAVDAAVLISAIHLFADAAGALREVRRVIRDGPFVLMAFTLENLRPLFVYDYFGGRWPDEIRTSRADLEGLVRDAGFAEVTVRHLVFRDATDGSLAALHTDPRGLADPARLRNTSFWHRIDQATRREGLDALERDLRSGALDRRVQESLRLAEAHGHGSVFVATT